MQFSFRILQLTLRVPVGRISFSKLSFVVLFGMSSCSLWNCPASVSTPTSYVVHVSKMKRDARVCALFFQLCMVGRLESGNPPWMYLWLLSPCQVPKKVGDLWHWMTWWSRMQVAPVELIRSKNCDMQNAYDIGPAISIFHMVSQIPNIWGFGLTPESTIQNIKRQGRFFGVKLKVAPSLARKKLRRTSPSWE